MCYFCIKLKKIFFGAQISLTALSLIFQIFGSTAATSDGEFYPKFKTFSFDWVGPSMSGDFKVIM